MNIDRLPLVSRNQRRNQILIGVKVLSFAQMHLVHSLAVLVEKLEAAENLVSVTLFHGKSMRP